MSLITILLLHLVSVYWIQWIQWKSFRENSNIKKNSWQGVIYDEWNWFTAISSANLRDLECITAVVSSFSFLHTLWNITRSYDNRYIYVIPTYSLSKLFLILWLYQHLVSFPETLHVNLTCSITQLTPSSGDYKQRVKRNANFLLIEDDNILSTQYNILCIVFFPLARKDFYWPGFYWSDLWSYVLRGQLLLFQTPQLM